MTVRPHDLATILLYSYLGTLVLKMDLKGLEKREINGLMDNDTFRTCKYHNLHDAHAQSYPQDNISTACVVSKIAT